MRCCEISQKGITLFIISSLRPVVKHAGAQLPEGRNMEASGTPEQRLGGRTVRVRSGERSLAGKAKVAQELPSYPSGAVTRGQPGEKASTGTRGYVAMLKTQIDDFE